MTSISDLGLDLSTTPSSLGQKGQVGKEKGKQQKSSVKSARWLPWDIQTTPHSLEAAATPGGANFVNRGKET